MAPIQPLSEASRLRRHIFFPYAEDQAKRVEELGGRFAYYTTAATAFLILQNKEIWLRSTLTMNDFMEVEHGLRSLMDAYKSPCGVALDQALDSVFPGLSQDVKRQFDAWIPGFRRDTFIACFSVHRREEDEHGRLSMWRAYGGASGVALVFNGAAFFQETDALAAYSSPVAYMGSEQLAAQINRVTERIAGNRAYVESLGRDGLRETVFQMLRYAAVSTKHPAFREEEEWRVVASPAMAASDLVRQDVALIGDVPQTVLKLKLEDRPDRGVGGLNPSVFIDRILIGPCEHPDVIFRAMWKTLADLGVADPDKKIMVTGVPLRPNQR